MYTAQSMDLKEELFELVTMLEQHLQNSGDEYELDLYQKFKLALEMQKNRLYMEAHVLGKGTPSALEKVSIALKEK